LSASRLAGSRLLIADDDEDVRATLAMLLTQSGASIQVVGSGLDALDAIAHDGPFALVITDVRMPAPSGVQLLAMARTAGADVPFLVITAFADAQVATTVDQVDGAVLLGKPFDAAELIRVAERMVGAD
jgi:CheY-like chemotaxis protein